jgi:hypothetical protein
MQMSKAEDEIGAIPDSTILDPFRLKAVILPQGRNKQEVKTRIDGLEFDDTGESLLHMREEETKSNVNELLIEWMMPW